MRSHLRTALLVTSMTAAATAQGLQYPSTRTVDQVDTYHGTKVPDPYRWLEDDTSAETAAWVEAQNKVTFSYLEKIPYRAQLLKRLNSLYDYAKYSTPSRKGEHYFFTRNSGLQNQSVLYIQRGLEGAPEVLIDPNTWSADGTVRLAGYEASKDGTLLAYAVSRSGSDWQELNVLDLTTRKPLADKVEWVKVSDIAWRDRGFYYSRYPTPAKGKERSSVNENHQVFYHRVGAPQAEDTLVFEDPKNPDHHVWQATLLKLNPFTHLAISYQEILFFPGPVGHLPLLLLLGAISIVFFLSGYFLFDRLRDTFAEEV